MNFIERMMDIFEKYPDRTGVVDSEKSYTYAEMKALSGKVYSWLKKNGIGKECFVEIVMPRSSEAIIAMLGVIRCGAAFILLEDSFPKERTEYVKKDVDAKVVINKALYDEIVTTESSVDGYEITSPHDSAFAVYTSGSTGNPKGVLHEYGNLNLFATVLPESDEYIQTSAALIAPFYFVASVLLVVNCVTTSRTIYIIPFDMIRDLKKLSAYIEENKIMSIYLSPSYIRMYKNPSQHLELVCTGSEPANGIYYEGGKPVIQNIYTMSEAGFPVISFVLDKAYDEAPVGKPSPGLNLYLEDEEGNVIEGAGKGEICFVNPFVRGYINLPEKTSEAFKNGVYHTGDIGRRDENGMYYIVGRKDDMFKVNGNRVEPGEIEAVMRRVTGLDSVAAKGFEQDGRSYICMYYVRSEAEKLGIIEGDKLTCDMSPMSDTLPRYMIPTYYIALDKLPINQNGKLVRKELKAPENVDFQSDYVAPSNEREELICRLMAEVLGVEKVGAEDDFLLVGGDSMKSIELIERIAEEGYDISDSELYKCRTPKKLAEIISKKKPVTEEELMAAEKDAETRPQPLLPVQKMWASITAEHREAALVHLPAIYKFKKGTDLEKLKNAVDKVCKHYPILQTRIVENEDGSFSQIYDPDIFKPIEVTEIDEKDLKQMIPTLAKRLDLFEGVAYRKMIYKTKSAIYLFMHFHHSIADGTSVGILRNSIYECYKNPDYQLPNDYYYYILEQMQKEKGNDVWKEAEKYYKEVFEDKFKISECSCKIDPDMEGDFVNTGIFREMKGFLKHKDRTNLFYLTATALAVAKTNGTNKALVSMTYSGRDRKIKMDSAGCFAVRVPVYILIEDSDTPESLLQKVKEQIEFGTSHTIYPYFKEDIADLDNSVIFLYQKDIYNIGRLGELVDEQIQVPPSSPIQPCRFFSLAVIDTDKLPILPYACIYSAQHYSPDKIKSFKENFVSAVKYLSGKKGEF